MLVRDELKHISKNEKLIVAVSAGADSVALLHLLLDVGFINLVIAHFDHRLRGRASKADMQFVKRLAAKLTLPFEGGSGDVKFLAKSLKVSLETAARQARYDFLADTARKQHSRSLLLAHHADDQVETCFFQFLRGSGAAGLAGMKSHSRRLLRGLTLNIHRPLLSISKDQLLGYLSDRKLAYREDTTNAVPDTSRNKLRLQILPFIEELLGSSFRGSIIRNAKIFADEEEFLSGLASPMALHAELRVKILQQIHPALLRRVLHAWLKSQGIIEPGMYEVELTSSLLATEQEGKSPSKVNLPGNFHARRRNGLLFVEKSAGRRNSKESTDQ